MRALACAAGIAMLATACAEPPASHDAAIATAPIEIAPRFSLDDVQGCWWLDCGQPHAEFCVHGQRVTGDFISEGSAAVAGDRLLVVFPDEYSLEDRIMQATREQLVLDGPAGRIKYRACP